MTHLLARAASDATGSAAASTAPYEALRQRHLQDMRSRIPEILQRLTWPAEKLKAERERRLRELLQIAKQRSAWHRTRLARIDPDRATEASLQDIAPMTKDDLMANFDAISTTRASRRAGLPAPEVEITAVPRIERPVSGKLKR